MGLEGDTRFFPMNTYSRAFVPWMAAMLVVAAILVLLYVVQVLFLTSPTERAAISVAPVGTSPTAERPYESREPVVPTSAEATARFRETPLEAHVVADSATTSMQALHENMPDIDSHGFGFRDDAAVSPTPEQVEFSQQLMADAQRAYQEQTERIAELDRQRAPPDTGPDEGELENQYLYENLPGMDGVDDSLMMDDTGQFVGDSGDPEAIILLEAPSPAFPSPAR